MSSRRGARDVASRAQTNPNLTPSMKKYLQGRITSSPDNPNRTAYDAPSRRTDSYTYFTRPEAGTQLVQSANQWLRIYLELQTAGPVAYGTRENLEPVLSGKGALLPTGEEIELVLADGNRLYFASESINRINIRVEPLPWLQQIYSRIGNLLERFV